MAADQARRDGYTEMNDYTELALGSEGLQFILSELRGGRTFSRCLLESLDLQSGDVITYLPQGASVVDAKDFESGGKLPQPPQSQWKRGEGAIVIPTPTTRPHLVSLIDEYLSTSERVCILENATASRGDEWLKQTQVNVSFFGDEVYHLLIGSCPRPTIDLAIRKGQSLFTFVGALTSLPGGVLPLTIDRADLDLGALRSLAEQTERIFVGAYDGEGYVIWRRAPR